MCKQGFLRQLPTGFKDEDARETVGGQASLQQTLPFSLFSLSAHFPFLPSLLFPVGEACSHGMIL